MTSNLRQSGSDPGNRICIFGEQHCKRTQQTISIQAYPCKCSGLAYFIRDESENEIMQGYRQCNTWRMKHILQTPDGQDICVLKRKIWSFRHTFHMYSGSDFQERRATMRFRFSCRPKAYIYVYDRPFLRQNDDTVTRHLKHSLVIRSTIIGLEIKIFDAETGEVYATMKKSIGCCAQSYTVTVEPGCDVAFLTGLILMWDVSIQEQQGAA